MAMGTTNEVRETESPSCPVCASRHVARAVVLRGDYRCPDCSALFDADGRIAADPRSWVEPRAPASRADGGEPIAGESNGPDERGEPEPRPGEGSGSKRTK